MLFNYCINRIFNTKCGYIALSLSGEDTEGTGESYREVLKRKAIL